MTSIDISSTADLILESFTTLAHRPMPAGAIDATRILGRSDAWVGVSADRELSLLIEVRDETHVPERRMSALTVGIGASFRVVESATDADFEQRFAAISLRPGNDELASSFALIAATLLSTLSSEPTGAEVLVFVDSIVQLVASSRSVAFETVLGLWGELWLMTSVSNPTVLALGWHLGVSDRFDFSFTQSRIEVKTTLSSSRRHEFTLEQLDGDDAKPLWIASIQAVKDASGRTVVDLLDELVGLLPAEVAGRVLRVALDTLSGDAEAAQDFRFEPVGSQPLAIYGAGDIPRVSVPEGSGIFGVRFGLDLDHVRPTGQALDESFF